MEETDSVVWSSDDGKSNDLSLTTTDAEENYFSPELNDDSLTTVAALENAIDQVKALVLETEGVSEERKKLVKRLIELRLKLQDVKEMSTEIDSVDSDYLRVVNHHQFILQKQPLHRSAQYCDKCNGVIWTIIQSWYRCKGCFYQCHVKCMNEVVRPCQFLKVSNETPYILDICPEVGLASQGYKCAECRVHFTLKNGWMEPRRCDYDGWYYCPLCHKNSTLPIPARIIHNWDFEEKPICEASRQFLVLMSRKPNIFVEQLNPRLFYFVEELNTVKVSFQLNHPNPEHVTKRLREEILIMKEYFVTCREAGNLKLLRMLEERQHFVENSHMYSLQDLIDTFNLSLVNYLQKIHGTFVRHIKDECAICRGKGFICEICENIQVIFPFDSATYQCSSCYSVFHSICFAKRDQCPKCLRLNRRKSAQQQ